MVKKAIFTLIGAFALLSGVASSHEQHGTRYTIENTSSYKMNVFTYHGDDGVCWSSHTDHYIDPGQTKTIKCHGNGKHRCKVSIKRQSVYHQKCDVVKNKGTIECYDFGATSAKCVTED